MRAALRKVIYILFHFRLVLCYTFSGPSPPQDNPKGFKDEKRKRGRKCCNRKRWNYFYVHTNK